MSEMAGSFDLQGKVVLVSAAGREPGRALALAFARAGARVAANDFMPMGLDETVKEIRDLGGEVRSYQEDVSKGLPAGALVDWVIKDFGRLDVLLNFAAARPQAPLLDMDEWDWLRTLDFNLNGPFLMMKAAGRAMSDRGGGVIINIAGACQGQAQAPGMAAYNASTSGLLALTQTAAVEFLAYNICVHAICAEEDHPGSVESVCRLALFLCSSQPAGLTGQVFRLGLRKNDGKE